jgi:hypothetical protein
MAGFTSLITRQDASPLIPVGEAQEIIKLATTQSAALNLFRRVNMSSKVTTQPVLSALSGAYWVNGDTGLKQTGDMAWQGIDLTAEEIGRSGRVVGEGHRGSSMTMPVQQR